MTVLPDLTFVHADYDIKAHVRLQHRYSEPESFEITVIGAYWPKLRLYTWEDFTDDRFCPRCYQCVETVVALLLRMLGE